MFYVFLIYKQTAGAALIIGGALYGELGKKKSKNV